jgi:hypothetical protein
LYLVNHIILNFLFWLGKIYNYYLGPTHFVKLEFFFLSSFFYLQKMIYRKKNIFHNYQFIRCWRRRWSKTFLRTGRFIDCWHFWFNTNILKKSTTSTNFSFFWFLTHFNSVFFFTHTHIRHSYHTKKIEQTELSKRDFHATIATESRKS